MDENSYNRGIEICCEASIMRARARIAGMEAENEMRRIKGESPAYVEEQFDKVLIEEGITHNQIVGELQRRY